MGEKFDNVCERALYKLRRDRQGQPRGIKEGETNKIGLKEITQKDFNSSSFLLPIFYLCMNKIIDCLLCKYEYVSKCELVFVGLDYQYFT